MECTTESLFGALVQCAQLGLEPNTPMGHAYMIPFRNRKMNRTDVQVIIGYRGFIDLARRSGQIVSIAAHAVHEKDKFDFSYGLDERLEHRPASGDRGQVTHFYAVAKLTGGGHAFEVMTRADVEAIRDASQNHQSAKKFGKPSVWDQHFVEMGRKTAVRRLFKYLPVSIELATAAALDGAADAGRDQSLADALHGEWTVVPDDMPTDGDETEEGDDSTSQQHTNGDAPEWPQKFKDPETREETWTDSAGEFFDKSSHAWSQQTGAPAVNSDGSFRKRRGTASSSDDSASQTGQCGPSLE
jgi:recombination protein RecT